MTRPTSAQLAGDVPPVIRDYIDAKIEEAVAALTNDFHMGLQAIDQTAAFANQRLAEIATFEKLVRGHLGL